MSHFKTTDEEFKIIVASSISKRQAIQKLGLAPKGDNYRTFDRRCLNLKVDTSHFKGNAWAKGRTFPSKRKIEDYLSNSKSIQSYKLKKIIDKRKYIRKNLF